MSAREQAEAAERAEAAELARHARVVIDKEAERARSELASIQTTMDEFSKRRAEFAPVRAGALGGSKDSGAGANLDEGARVVASQWTVRVPLDRRQFEDASSGSHDQSALSDERRKENLLSLRREAFQSSKVAEAAKIFTPESTVTAKRARQDAPRTRAREAALASDAGTASARDDGSVSAPSPVTEGEAATVDSIAAGVVHDIMGVWAALRAHVPELAEWCTRNHANAVDGIHTGMLAELYRH